MSSVLIDYEYLLETIKSPKNFIQHKDSLFNLIDAFVAKYSKDGLNPVVEDMAERLRTVVNEIDKKGKECE